MAASMGLVGGYRDCVINAFVSKASYNTLHEMQKNN